RARLDLEQPFALEREPQRAPTHRGILVLAAGLAAEIGERLVAADVDSTKDHRLVARRVEDVAVEPRLAVPLRQRGRDEELELGADQAYSVGPGQAEHRQVVAQARVHHDLDALPVARERLDVAHLRVSGLPLAA